MVTSRLFCSPTQKWRVTVFLAVGGVETLLSLMLTSDDMVVNNAAFALSQVLQHVEAKDALYKLHGMKVFSKHLL